MSERLPAPVHQLALFLTESCNLGCEYCFAAGMNNRHASDELIRQSIDRLFDLCGSETRLGITFWGGEPFLRFKQIRMAVNYAEERARKEGKGIGFTAPTNATLLSPRVLDFCKEHRISLSLSIDGNEDSQSVRKLAKGGNSFPLVAKRLPLIREKLGRDVPIRMTISPEKVQNLYEDVIFFLGQGFREVLFYPATDGNWSGEAMEIYRRELERLAGLYEERLSSGDRETMPRFRAFDDVLVRLTVPPPAPGKIEGNGKGVPQLGYCGAGQRMIAVSIDGDVYPCHRFVFYDREARHYRAGDIQQDRSQWAALEDFADVDAAKAHVDGQLCLDCEDQPLCSFFCVAHNYHHSGDIYGVQPDVCRLMKVKLDVLRDLHGRVKNLPFFTEYMKFHLSRRDDRLGSRLRVARFKGTWDRVVDKVAEDVWKRLGIEG